jgi:hypothetical protein
MGFKQRSLFLGFNNALPLSSPGLTGRSSIHHRAGISTGPIYWVYIPALHWHHRLLGRPVKPGDDTGGVRAMTPVVVLHAHLRVLTARSAPELV